MVVVFVVWRRKIVFLFLCRIMVYYARSTVKMFCSSRTVPNMAPRVQVG